MWKYPKRTCVFLLFLWPAIAFSQPCNLVVSGTIKEVGTDIPVAFANVYLRESQSVVKADSLGHFTFQSVCKGAYHLSASRIGFETGEWFMDISRDTSVDIYLHAVNHSFNGIVVTGRHEKSATQEAHSIHAHSIAQNANENLATTLESISGVRSINNGSGISKPVIHGLYGNRLTILNNGVAQSGQQWGVDHGPAIDPLAAERITVLKGVAALEYMGSSLGGIVLIEPGSIEEEPHLHGRGGYFFESNGLGNGLNIRLQKYSEKLAWRVGGTLKKSGDKRTSRYYLRNTGGEEANVNVQLERSWGERWHTELYLSSFNARLGVLRGAHIGNLSDLEEALRRDVPFFTEDEFSYAIGAPNQEVHHHLAKASAEYQIDERQCLDFTYAAQYNLRKEFDVRRSGRSEDPALSLKQLSNFFEIRYSGNFRNGWSLKSGLQINRVENTNLPETGILPLIPDYIAYQYGLFALATKRFNKMTFEFGSRYEGVDRRIAAISTTVPRTILRYRKNDHNFSAMAGFKYRITPSLNMAYNLGYAERNPEVNELYSNGLHQGVSGIEEGNPDLNAEASIKNTLSFHILAMDQLFFETQFYYQNIDDYIYLQPQNKIRLTIRGAFPVFKYEQTHARIAGFDFSGTYRITERFRTILRYGFLKGDDLSKGLPLIYMPSNQLYNEWNYQLSGLGKFQNTDLQLNFRYVFEQNNLESTQDFAAVPEPYALVGLKISTQRQLARRRVELFVKVDNLLNESYRDYLNRQRYFADDQGIRIVAGVNVSF